MKLKNPFKKYRNRSRIKRAGFALKKAELFSSGHTPDTFNSLLQINHPINYSLDTFKTLDSMILSKLQLLQFGIPFQEARFFTLNLPPWGFAAAVTDALFKGLTYSHLYNRTLLVNDSNLVYDFCYEPVSIHSLKDIDKKYIREAVEFNFLHQEEKVVYIKYLRSYLPRIINLVSPLSLPLDVHYFRGLILGSFLRLKQEYKAHIEEKKKEIGFKTPIIGVHIRHGDVRTVMNGYRFIPFETYLEVVKQMVNQTGIKTIFVTTDSEEVIQQLPKHSGIDFIYDDKEIRYSDTNAGLICKRPELRKQETMTAVKNIYLLADCNYIIGSISNWFHNSLSLSYFRNKKLNGVLIFKEKGSNTGYSVRSLIVDEGNIQQACTGP